MPSENVQTGRKKVSAPPAKIPAEIKEPPPVWPAATSRMKIDVTVTQDSKVYVLHDQHFPDYLEWIEFDADTQIMTFITAGGKLQDLGLTLYAPMDRMVAEATSACVIFLRDKKMKDMGIVPLVVRRVTEEEERK